LALSIAACGEDAPPTTQAPPTVDRGPGPSAESDPVGATLHRQVVAHALDFEEVGTTITGELDEGATHTHALILIGTWCYRIFAQGGPDMADLELELVDPNGVPAQHDPEEGPSASLGIEDGLCPYYAGRYTLKVRAGRGQGGYALRVFRNQML
jgi:hypothetical protein